MFHTNMFLPRSMANLPVALEQFCNFQRRLEISSSLFLKCIFLGSRQNTVCLLSPCLPFFWIFQQQFNWETEGKRLVILLLLFAFFVAVLDFSFCTTYGACSIQILKSYTFFHRSAIWKTKFLLELASRISTKIQ